jgi:hypothetical protein
VLRAVSLGINRQGREGDHLYPFSANVKNDGAIPPLPYMYSLRGAIKHKDNFTFAAKKLVRNKIKRL